MLSDSSDEGGKRIKSVQRAFQVIRKIREQKTVRIADLVQSMDIPRSTAHVYLKTLEEEGFVIHGHDGYRLSVASIVD